MGNNFGNGSAEPGLEIRLFGELSVSVRGRTLLSFRTYKSGAVLAYLALRNGQPVDRNRLAKLFWPDSPDAAYNLRRSLHELRDALGEENGRVYNASGQTVALNLDQAFCDYARFHILLRTASVVDWEAAASLYRGDLMEGIQEEWFDAERRVCLEAYRKILERLAVAARQRGDGSAAADFLWHLLQVEPLHESALRELMELHAASGDLGAALEAYRNHRQRVTRVLETDLSHGLKTLYEKIRAEYQRSATSTPPTEIPARPGPVVALPAVEDGPLSPESPLYVARREDAEFSGAIRRRDGTILLKGARQTGKTSLAARGLNEARQSGDRTAYTTLARFSQSQMDAPATFFMALAEHLADALELPIEPTADFGWRPDKGPNDNFEGFLRRHILKPFETQVVWVLDDVDRLFRFDYRDDVFGLFRSWYNYRAMNPESVWNRLTLVIAYATEANLLVKDLNQSPFNVGTKIPVGDFSFEELADANRRVGSPLPGSEPLQEFHRLVGGHPHLIRIGLNALARGVATPETLCLSVANLDGPFGSHLRAVRTLVEGDAALRDGVRLALGGRLDGLSLHTFHLLRTAGILAGDGPANARFRARVYDIFFREWL